MATALEELLEESRKLRNGKAKDDDAADGVVFLLLLPFLIASHVFEALAIAGLILRLQWWWPATFGPALPRGEIACTLIVLSTVIGWYRGALGRKAHKTSEFITAMLARWLMIGTTYLALWFCH